MRFDGQKLRKLRTGRSWDQHRLAEAARSHGSGITQSQISRYENGQEPSGRNVIALAAALDVEPGEFYGLADDEPTPVADLPLLSQLMDEIALLRGRSSVRTT